MSTNWGDRNAIVANLFNPAFCGEIIRVVAYSYNKHSNNKFPFAFSYIVLPIILHEETRRRMPRSTRTYFFVWVEENDKLFFDFSTRTKNMVRSTKEALLFLLTYKRIELTEKGEIITIDEKPRHFNSNDHKEYDEIIKKAAMFGKWLSTTNDVKSIYSFFRITP